MCDTARRAPRFWRQRLFGKIFPSLFTRREKCDRIKRKQAAGSALRSAAVLIAFYGFGGGLPVASIWTSIVTGLPGIVLQWALVPLIVFWVERMAARKGEHD